MKHHNTLYGKETVVRVLLGPDGKPKQLFQDNKLWRVLNRLFKADIRVPFVTGIWTFAAQRHNTIPTVGKQLAAQQIGGTTTTPVTAIALGTDTPGTTALGAEITTNGGARGAATVTNTTETVTGDTEQWQKTFTFTGSLAITEEGLFNNNTSGGIMFASQSFAAVNVADGDTLQITHKFTQA